MYRRQEKRRMGFTLIELLIVIAIISILVSIAMPAYGYVRELANRARCSRQLQQTVTAMKAYALDHRGRWPNAFTAESACTDELPDEPDGGPGLRGPNREEDDGGQYGTDNEDAVVNSNAASLWLLVAGDYVAPQTLVCPSTADLVDEIRNPEEVRDFLSRQHCSYSYQCRLGGRRIRETWRLAVVADRSPFFDPYNEADDPEARSFNHWGEGQNVAFGDGHVEWMREPYLRTTGDWFYRAWTAPDDRKPADIPDGEDVPQGDEDALLK